ncbi:MAG: ATP-binding protein [Candidatus Nomurabacteria bacterium]|jgi:predicted AAA+ superfamily ATPase|nr:ATP-binding protein [Candidatus Nomurabacteria bacterium]
MEENELLTYLQRQTALGRDRLKKYVTNGKGKAYPKRNIFIKTKQYVDDFLGGRVGKRWVIIPGLRGTGKTTILAQTYYYLNDEYGDSINLLYFSLNEAVDTIGANLMNLLSEYERLIGESYEVLTKPTVLLIDEVQSDSNWAPVLKALNERSNKVFIICSGSSAVHLQDDADISGRRAAIERLYPMNFCEFEMIKYDVYPESNLKSKLLTALYSSQSAKECYERLSVLKNDVDRYWSKVDRRHWTYYIAAGSLPFALSEKTIGDVYESVLASVDKVITKDIPELGRFSSDTIPVIMRLLYILAESDAISNNKLADVLGVKSPLTVANILETLTKSELLIRVMPHGSQINSAKKPSKYLFSSSVIRAAFFHLAGSSATMSTREGRLLEDIAGLHYYRNFNNTNQGEVYYDSAENGADFILKRGVDSIAIEVGKGKKSPVQVSNTMKRVQCKYGLTICQSNLALSDDEQSLIVPWDFFSLAC